MAATPVPICIDSDVKAQANALFACLGLDMSGAVNLFLRQCVLRGWLPFAVETLRYGRKTPEAMVEARRILRGPSVKGYSGTELREERSLEQA